MNSSSAVVLDTHVWIWLVSGEGKLLTRAVSAIAQASVSSQILIPAICVWELALLESRGKISLDKPLAQWIGEALAGPGMSLAHLTPEISIASCFLPGNLHNDPADRMIVATARVERATLITRDGRLLDYGKQGYVDVLPA